MLYKLAESLGNRGAPDERPEKSPLVRRQGVFSCLLTKVTV